MFALGFQHFPRDLANVNEWKIMFDPSYIQLRIHTGDCFIFICTICAIQQTDTTLFALHLKENIFLEKTTKKNTKNKQLNHAFLLFTPLPQTKT